MESRRQQSKTAFSGITERCIAKIKARLKQYHSPEKIAGRIKREGPRTISHETIYQMIYANHQGLKEYQQYLRQGRGKRRKRGGSNSKRGQIPGRVAIALCQLYSASSLPMATVYTHLGQGINVLRDPPKSPRWRAAALEKRGTLNPVPPFFKGG